jgi:hypothetical protein
MNFEQILSVSGGVLVVGGALAFLWGVVAPLVRKTKALLDKLDHFTRDWFGEEATPGRDAVPGVMERLNRIDGELKHNGGSSMKDSQKRIENKLKAIEARLEDGNVRFERLEEKVK